MPNSSFNLIFIFLLKRREYILKIKENNKYFYIESNIFFCGSTKKVISDKNTFKKNLNITDFYHSEQVHGNYISEIDKKKFFYKNCDGLIAFEKLEFPVVIKTADCVPVFFFHKSKNIYGILHAGRKGTELGISINLMKILKGKKLNVNDFYFFIGPAICKNCYEIDTVKKIHFDLKKENINQLLENNVIKENIMDFNLCTKSNLNLYSYRGNDKERRIFNFIFCI
ncbi:MAG: polyphenol oxidase family protein [Candidatus Muiribacteriota bacterium]